jgi:hypothetical protein
MEGTVAVSIPIRQLRLPLYRVKIQWSQTDGPFERCLLLERLDFTDMFNMHSRSTQTPANITIH